MSLKEEVSAEVTQKCVMARLRNALSPEEYSDLEELIADASVSTTAIKRVLDRRGLGVARSSLNVHRQKACGYCRI